MPDLHGSRIGFALCGSYCVFSKVFPALDALLAAGAEVVPIVSENAARTDTRFGDAEAHLARLEALTGRAPIRSIAEAEPIGPRRLLDLLVVAPCTGNTLAKLANGIADTTVTLAVKAHLRNERPVVLAVSTNDALAGNAASIGMLLNRRHYYFVPMRQDDPGGKPRSVVADFSRLADTAAAALRGEQLQPILAAPVQKPS